MLNLIILYHGSIDCFEEIDVSRGKPFKDFGAGFYTSRDRRHAENLARRNREIELLRNKKLGKENKVDAWIYTYELKRDLLADLSVKQFDGISKEWILFVVKNRTNETKQHNYDVVIGPTANDNTRIVINAFLAGLYGDTQNDEAVNILLKMIEADKLPGQFFFGSNRAAELLTFKRREKIK
ncbi:MAG: DUF3990 domain-containing protein [Planctomycetaceae bacterium]|jgi:hypothetical protein|nr:DUF3990 domain-containing protein [Planctomycetaceae bacterium]